MTDPYARNRDEDRACHEADMIHIGHDDDDNIVVAFQRFGLKASQPGDVGAFLNREAAMDFLGRFTSELKAKGWLS